MEILLASLAVTVYAVSCIGWGMFVLQRIGIDRQGPLNASAALAISFSLGLGLLAQVWALMALAGLFTMPLIVSMAGAGFIFVILQRSQIIAWLNRIAADLSSTTMRLPWMHRSLTLGAGLIVLAHGWAALALPPTGDADSYYMPLAKLAAAEGALVPLPGYEPFLQNGVFGELHFAALMTWGLHSSAKGIVWFVAASVLILLIDLCRLTGSGEKAGVWIAVFLSTSSAFLYIIHDGKVDLFAAGAGLASVTLLFRMPSSPSLNWFGLIGFMAGCALIAKLSYAACFVPVIFALCFLRLIQDGTAWRRLFSLMTVMSVGFLIPFAFHSIKNTLLFGQPLAPFVVFGEESFLNQTWFSAETTRWILASYPWALTLGAYPMQHGVMSPLALACLPLGLALARPASWFKSGLVQLTLAGLVGVVLWMVSAPSVLAPRYILVSLLMLLPFCAKSAESAEAIESSPRLIGVSLALGALLLLGASAYKTQVWLPAAKSMAAGEPEAMRAAAPWDELWPTLNQSADNNARIFMAMYERFFLRIDLLKALSTYDEFKEAQSIDEPARFINYLEERNFDYIAVDSMTHPEFHRLASDQSVSGRLSSVFSNDRLHVYQVKAP